MIKDFLELALVVAFMVMAGDVVGCLYKHPDTTGQIGFRRVETVTDSMVHGLLIGCTISSILFAWFVFCEAVEARRRR